MFISLEFIAYGFFWISIISWTFLCLIINFYYFCFCKQWFVRAIPFIMFTRFLLLFRCWLVSQTYGFHNHCMRFREWYVFCLSKFVFNFEKLLFNILCSLRAISMLCVLKIFVSFSYKPAIYVSQRDCVFWIACWVFWNFHSEIWECVFDNCVSRITHWIWIGKN